MFWARAYFKGTIKLIDTQILLFRVTKLSYRNPPVNFHLLTHLFNKQPLTAFNVKLDNTDREG